MSYGLDAAKVRGGGRSDGIRLAEAIAEHTSSATGVGGPQGAASI